MAEESGGAFISGRSEEDEVILKQMNSSPFGGGDVMNLFLKGLERFGYNFSVIADTLIQFFQATKLFLEAFKNPLTAALIETIDSLIEALEELDALGFGNVSVWPWEHGTYPAMLDTSRLDEAILGLAAALEGIDAKTIGFAESGAFIKTENGETLLTPGQKLYAQKSGDNPGGLTKRFVYDTLMGVRNYFHPETWKGSSVFYTDTAAAAAKRQAAWHPGMGISQESLSQSLTGQVLEGSKDALHTAIDSTQKNLLVKELTPEQCIEQILKSLSGSSPDSNKPTGSGPYEAFVIMFTLPTINGVIQILQSFVDYFGSVIGDPLLRKLALPDSSDDKEVTITLGESLGKPTQESIQRAMAVGRLETDYSLEQREYIQHSPGINVVPPLNLWDQMTTSEDEWFYELGDFKPRKVADGTYKVGNNEVPMFKPGDKIIQEGGVLGFTHFSAEVVEHFPIVVKNGMWIQNKVKVKSVRGEYLKTNHKPLNSATVPLVRAISKDFVSPERYPVFRSDTLEKPILRNESTFFGTISEGSNIIRHIIPNTIEGHSFRVNCQAEKGYVGIGSPFDMAMKKLLKSGGGDAFVDSYMKFLQGIKKGMIIDHQFLQPFDVSDRNLNVYKDSNFKGSDFKFNYGKLLDVIPSLGVQWHIANIKLDGVVVENLNDLTEEKLFLYHDDDRASGRPYGMRGLQFELGFLNADGSYDTELLNLDIKGAISPPNGVVYSWETKISTGKKGEDGKLIEGPPNPPFQLQSANKNVSPNWKYIRISDLFPAYGETITEAIGMVKKFKKQVQSIAKEIDSYIKFLERQIEAIQALNDQIQQLIAFFSKGLNAAGLYSGQFSGQGIGDFKSKLQKIKMLQTSPNKVNEITLETVETDTTIEDPFTGLEKSVKRKVLRPGIKVLDIEPDGIPKELHELDNLKYSGAIVFFAQGPDIEKFSKFMNNFNGLATLGKGFLANIFKKEDSIAQKIVPYVHEIQGQDGEGNWVNLDSHTIDDDGTIRIVFTNDAHELTKTDRDMINKQMEKNVQFSPKMQTGNISLTNDDTDPLPLTFTTKNDSIVLFQGTYTSTSADLAVRSTFSQETEYHQFSQQPKTSSTGGSPLADDNGKFDRQYFNVDLTTKIPLPRSNTKYKILVRSSITNFEGQTLKEEGLLGIGFDINPVSVEFGELV